MKTQQAPKLVTLPLNKRPSRKDIVFTIKTLEDTENTIIKSISIKNSIITTDPLLTEERKNKLQNLINEDEKEKDQVVEDLENLRLTLASFSVEDLRLFALENCSPTGLEDYQGIYDILTGYSIFDLEEGGYFHAINDISNCREYINLSDIVDLLKSSDTEDEEFPFFRTIEEVKEYSSDFDYPFGVSKYTFTEVNGKLRLTVVFE